MIRLIRIDEDNELAKLLKRHPKYKQEYLLNVQEQGLQYLVLLKMLPMFYAAAILEGGISIALNNLKEEGLI